MIYLYDFSSFSYDYFQLYMIYSYYLLSYNLAKILRILIIFFIKTNYISKYIFKVFFFKFIKNYIKFEFHKNFYQK